MSRTAYDRETRNSIVRFHDEVFHRDNRDALAAIFSEEYIAHGEGCQPGGERKSISQLKESVASMRGAFPALRITAEKVISSVGEGTAEISCCYRFEGTQCGWLWGIAPTFRRVNVAGMDFYRISGGEIVEGWESFDTLGMIVSSGSSPQRPDPPRPLTPAPAVLSLRLRLRGGVPATVRQDGWSNFTLLIAFSTFSQSGTTDRAR